MMLQEVARMVQGNASTPGPSTVSAPGPFSPGSSKYLNPRPLLLKEKGGDGKLRMVGAIGK